MKADWNYKKEDAFTSSKLRENLKRNGQIENIIVRELETGFYEIVNGNHRYDDMVAIGATSIIAYNCGTISLAQAQRIAVETNETRFDSDIDKLAALMREMRIVFPEEELSLTMPFQADDFYAMMNTIGIDMPAIEEDNVVADSSSNATPFTTRGDLYTLGKHRLLCGDSTNADDVARLMDGNKAHLLFTDPPYNVNYAALNVDLRGGKDWGEEYCSEWADSMSDEEYNEFLFKFLSNAKNNMIEYAHYYVWYASAYHSELCAAFLRIEVPYDKVPIVWVKNRFPISWVHYKRKYEPCIFGGKGAINGNGTGARWYGPNNESSVWEFPLDPSTDYVHPTQKPIGLAARALQNSSQPGELVLDLFGGSGSTMMACEQMNRRNCSMEYEPRFCDEIVKRYWRYCTAKNIACEITHNGSVLDVNSLIQETTNE